MPRRKATRRALRKLDLWASLALLAAIVAALAAILDTSPRRTSGTGRSALIIDSL